jgi:hypothetical protein
MDITIDLLHFDSSCIYFCSPGPNSVINNGVFNRIYYSTDMFSMNGINVFCELEHYKIEKYYNKLKSRLKDIDIDDYDETFLGNKEVLNFPFHQRLIEKRTSILIAEGFKLILWGCKPRSGKTYMTGLLIISQSELYKNYNVLIITPAPTVPIVSRQREFVEEKVVPSEISSFSSSLTELSFIRFLVSSSSSSSSSYLLNWFKASTLLIFIS